MNLYVRTKEFFGQKLANSDGNGSYRNWLKRKKLILRHQEILLYSFTIDDVGEGPSLLICLHGHTQKSATSINFINSMWVEKNSERSVHHTFDFPSEWACLCASVRCRPEAQFVYTHCQCGKILCSINCLICREWVKWETNGNDKHYNVGGGGGGDDDDDNDSSLHSLRSTSIGRNFD